MKYTKFKRILLSTLLTVFSFVVIQIIATPKANALLNLTPDVGNFIPFSIHWDAQNCDAGSQSPKFNYWFSNSGASNVDVPAAQTVPYGTTSVPLRFNWSGTVCFTNSAVSQTALQFSTIPPGVNGLPPGMSLNYTSGAGPGDSNVPGTYRGASPLGGFVDFNYAPLGGFTTSGAYTFTIAAKRINQFPGSFGCVSGGTRDPVNLLDFGPCSTVNLTASFWVNVTPNAPTLTVNNVGCDGINVSTSGARVDVYGPGPTPIGGTGSAQSGFINLNGVVAPGTTLDVYGIAGPGQSSNAYKSHQWVRDSACNRYTVGVGINNLALTGGDDNPTGVNAASTLGITYPTGGGYTGINPGGGITPNVTRTITVTKSGSNTTNSFPYSGRLNTNENYNDSLSFPPLSAGDTVCLVITATPQSGTLDGSGNIVTGSGNATANRCVTVANKPYVSVFGSDISAGGGFRTGASPCNQLGNIDTYTSDASGFGSGVQFAAFALGQISKFNSASLKTRGAALPLPRFGNGLTFSNQTAPLGQFTNSKCIHDYFADSADVSDPVPSNPMSLNAASGDYIHNGDLTITGGMVRKARHVRIFVNGTLTITGPINFEPDTPGNRRNSRTDIPSLVIVARNIKIDQSVPNLDGVYVAQPSAAQPNGGVIYTCTNGTNVYAGNEANLFDACKIQLVVNGSFVARHVQLLRTFGSIRNATNGEDPSDGARACNGALNGSAPVCAGEVFNFNPEIYLSLPIGDPDPNDLNGNYFNTVLPPIL